MFAPKGRLEFGITQDGHSTNTILDTKVMCKMESSERLNFDDLELYIQALFENA